MDPVSPHDRVAVLMAGGRGQRFWPLSTEARPKQFLDLEHGGRTLLQATFDRVLPLVGTPERVLVATAARYVELVREQLPHLPGGNVLVEPEARDSAPAIALASLAVRHRFGNALVGVFSSDHRIVDVSAFHEALHGAYEVARREAGLVTVGIPPSHPATAYGYIELGGTVPGGHRVARFVEKPNADRAEQYLRGGQHLWNAGMFVWPADVILQELERHAPDVLLPLRAATAAGRTERVFATLPRVSIDYAVLEHTERAFVVPATFDWDDIGDWVALERLLPNGDGNGNTVVGRHVGYEASRNIVYTDGDDDVIATLGVEDLVIVKRGNTVLLVRKDRVQDLKALLADERLANVVA